MIETPYLPAGRFSAWLRQTRHVLQNENGAAVPCGDCNACCRSSYFIHIRPEETRTLKRIPSQILFAAPGLPKGNLVLGYDKQGRCPMLIDNQCSIYAYRPRTCRIYDCRIFAAAGIAVGDAAQAPITQHIQRWQFDYPTVSDHNQHTAVRAAARFIQQRAACFPAGVIPNNTTQLAILAIKVYDVFLNYPDLSDNTGDNIPDLEIAQAVVAANAQFEAQRVTPAVHPTRRKYPLNNRW